MASTNPQRITKPAIIVVIEVILIVVAVRAIASACTRDTSPVVYVSIVPIVVSALITPLIFRLPGTPRKLYICAGILTLIYLFMLSILQLLDSTLFQRQSAIENAVYLAVFTASVYYCLLWLLSATTSAPPIAPTPSGDKHPLAKIRALLNATPSQRTLTIIFWSCFAAIVIVTALCVFATDQGVWISDDVAEIDARVKKGVWSDWHTVGYLLLVWLCYHIVPSPGSVVVLNGILWAALNFCILLYLRKSQRGMQMMIFYTVAAIIVFSPFYYTQVMYKDVPFSIGLVGESLLILYLIRCEKPKTVYLVFGGICVLFTMSLRHAGIIPAALGMVGVLIYLLVKKQQRKALAATIVLVAAFAGNGLVSYIGTEVFQAEENPAYVAYGTPLYMISAAAHEDIPFSEADQKLLEEVMPMDQWASIYNKYWVDDASRAWGKIGSERLSKVYGKIVFDDFGSDLIVINAHLLLSHPVFYVSHLLDPCSLLWQIAQPNDGTNWALVGSPRDENINYSPTYDIVQAYGKLTFNSPVLHAFCWRGGYSLFLLIAAAFILALKGRKRELLYFIPIAVFDLTLVFTMPSQDPRFILETIECVLLIMPYAALAKPSIPRSTKKR